MTDFSLYDEIINFHRVFDDDGPALPAPRGKATPSFPWDDPTFEFLPPTPDPQGVAFTKAIEAKALHTEIFGSFEVQAEPPMQKQTSLHDLVSSGVERTIAEMDVDDLRKALATASDESEPELQKRKQDFIKATAEKRSDRLWDICAKATRKLESIGFNTERLNLDGLHRSMNSFVEDAVLAT